MGRAGACVVPRTLAALVLTTGLGSCAEGLPSTPSFKEVTTPARDGMDAGMVEISDAPALGEALQSRDLVGETDVLRRHEQALRFF